MTDLLTMYERMAGLPIYYLKPSFDYMSFMVVECTFVSMHPYQGVVRILLDDELTTVTPAAMLQVPHARCLWIGAEHGIFEPQGVFLSVEELIKIRDRLSHEYRLRSDPSYIPQETFGT